MEDLKKYSPEGVHEKVFECLQGLKKGLVLDVPTGQGALSKELERVGFIVVSGDIERENILYRNNRSLQLDLNQPLPFKNSIFDYVVCVEGIEHLENPHGLIREFARIIKNDGHLIITTPNVMTIKSRWRFLFYSYLDYFRYFGPVPSSERHQIKSYDHQHINPLFYGEIRFILRKNGFRIEKIETNRLVRKRGIPYLFVKWLVKYKTKRKFLEDPLYVSDTLLEGENLIILSQKGENLPG